MSIEEGGGQPLPPSLSSSSSSKKNDIPVFEDGMMFITLAIQAISQDEFSKCFEPKPLPRPTSYLHYYLYLIGGLIRYGILLPIRLSTLVIGSIIFILILPFVILFGTWEFKSIFFLAYLKIWNFAFGAWVRHWGHKPICKKGEPMVFVSNHTSFVDFIILSGHQYAHATVAQTHGGLFGLIQNYLMSLNGSLCFHRNEAKDRILVTRRIKRHLKMEGSLDAFHQPLLIFPEGTCVNNECTVLFHKGAFELDCLVCPVAIKYNKRLLDPYWNTREQTFSEHCLYIMSRWLMVVDVWWLPPVRRMAGETSIEMAERVKEMISETAGLKNLSWDGYMKNFIKSHDQEKLKKCRQAEYASKVKSKLPFKRESSSLDAISDRSRNHNHNYNHYENDHIHNGREGSDDRQKVFITKSMKNGTGMEMRVATGNGRDNNIEAVPVTSKNISVTGRRRTIGDILEHRELGKTIASMSLPESSSNFLSSSNPFPSWLPDSTVIDLKNELLLYPHSSKIKAENECDDEHYKSGEHDDLLSHLLDHRADLVTTWRHFTTGHSDGDRRIENSSWRLLSSTISNNGNGNPNVNEEEDDNINNNDNDNTNANRKVKKREKGKEEPLNGDSESNKIINKTDIKNNNATTPITVTHRHHHHDNNHNYHRNRKN